jgi:adenylate kinase
MKIVLFGPQGSGKGTQAQALVEALKISHITTGEIFRNEIKIGSSVGKQIESTINQGKLVEDSLTIEVLKKRLSLPDCDSGFILDGYPRNLNQAQALDEITAIDWALEIWIPDEEVINRISNRRTCSQCGSVFNLITRPPKINEVCDQCQGKLVIRKDDTQEAILKRLEIYHQQTEPLKEYYARKGKLIKIDGRPSIDEVAKETFAKLKIQ